MSVSSASGWAAGSGVVEEATQDPALRAERERDEGVGRDGEAARLVNGQDRVPQRAVRLDRAVEVEPQQVAAERRHLLADDDIGAQAAVTGDGLGRDGRIDPLVVRDRDDIELGQPLDVVEDRLDAGRAVAGERVDVQVRAAEARRGVAVMPRPPWLPCRCRDWRRGILR